MLKIEIDKDIKLNIPLACYNNPPKMTERFLGNKKQESFSYPPKNNISLENPCDHLEDQK